ncbi:MerR family transcriptional regulator [Microbacterium sp. TWP3-1-2b2]|uniref:MerR family transcriptional regulator n=1 Tax=Microbacterium sp. TWP3-1-2b2 TaxID=2804651 RepID=UPI003CF341D2
MHPTDATDGGHRLYDVDAIARLEFVRTLRDLETGLDHVRRVLAGTSSLRDVLAEHLDVIESGRPIRRRSVPCSALSCGRMARRNERTCCASW